MTGEQGDHPASRPPAVKPAETPLNAAGLMSGIRQPRQIVVRDARAFETLWREHCAAPFPEGLAGEDVAGICLASLDTFTAGCIDAFLAHGGKLDSLRTAVLGLCYRDLSVVVSELEGEGQRYFTRLEKLARTVLEAVRDEVKLA